jgi:hypothetical protein
MPNTGWIDPDDYDRLVPYCVVPGQITRRPPTPLEQSWRRLCAAVLLDAILVLRRPFPGRTDLTLAARLQARQWLMAPDAPVTINLRDCCAAMGISLRRVQRALLLAPPSGTPPLPGPPLGKLAPCRGIPRT